MANIQNNYEADEFDLLAAERLTYGAHRMRRKKYGWIVAIIAILILAPVAGVFGSEWLSHSELAKEAISQTQKEKGNSDKSAVESQDEKKSDSDKSGSNQSGSVVGEDSQSDASGSSDPAKESDETAQGQADQPAPAPEPVITKEAPITVLNAANITGLAREKAQVLRNTGFTNVYADNYQGQAPGQSTVYYGDASLADTAKQVAADLGAGSAVENSAMARPGTIVVVLVTR